MSLVRWWKLDGNAYDSSHNRSHGTENGGIAYSTTVTKVGKSATFVGDGSDNIDVSLYTIAGHHTLTFWMYSLVDSPVSLTGSGVIGKKSLTHRIYIRNGYLFGFFNGSKIWSWNSDTDFYNKWRHVALTFDGVTLGLFLDGVDQGAGAGVGVYDEFNIDNIGDIHATSSYNFDGYLSDVRIYDHLLSIKEIKNLAEAKVLHWQFSHERNNTGQLILDSSGYGRNATLDASSPTWSSDTVVGVGCYDITSASLEYIEIDSTDFPVLFLDEISISLWVNYDTFDSWQTILHGNIDSTWTRSYWLATSSATNMRWAINGSGGSGNDFNPGLSAGNWYHIFATYDGSNGNVYINGVSKADNFSVTGDITAIYQTGFKIGLDGTEQPYAFGGRIADVRVYNKGYNATNGLAEALRLYQTSALIDNKGNLWC